MNSSRANKIVEISNTEGGAGRQAGPPTVPTNALRLALRREVHGEPGAGAW
jgi:hypothetical protein